MKTCVTLPHAYKWMESDTVREWEKLDGAMLPNKNCKQLNCKWEFYERGWKACLLERSFEGEQQTIKRLRKENITRPAIKVIVIWIRQLAVSLVSASATKPAFPLCLRS